MFEQYRPYKLRLMLMDVVLTIVALGLIEQARPYLPGRLILAGEAIPNPVLYLIVALLWHAVFAVTGAYDKRDLPNFFNQFRRLTFSYSLSVLLFAGILFFTFRDISRLLVIYFSILNFLFLFTARFVMTRFLKSIRNEVHGGAILIVGATDNGIYLAKDIMDDHENTVRVVGFIDDQPTASSDLPAPLLGSTADMERIIEEECIDVVVLALAEHCARDLDGLVFRLDPLPVRIYVVPDFSRLSLVSTDIDTIGNLVVIGIREPVIKGHRRVAKRVFDFVVSLLGIVFTWPILVLIAVAVKLDSPGPVIYVARRVGENGKLFDMYKFRTMVVDAERLQSLATETDEQGRPIYKVKSDQRVTRIGRFLRRTSLDELPQLVNVLKGEMSLVGPRPEQPFITQTYDHWQWQRLSVPPGVTGLWQISGRSDLPMHLNTQYDIFYVRNYSILLDLKILLKTLIVVFKGKGAY
mgnify:CR=1 FL=1